MDIRYQISCQFLFYTSVEKYYNKEVHGNIYEKS